MTTKRYKTISNRLVDLLSDVPFIKPLNSDLPGLPSIIRTDFTVTVSELDALFRVSDTLDELKANCARQHWSLIPVQFLTQQLDELANEFGIAIFGNGSGVTILKPARQYTVLVKNGVDIIDALFTNINQELLYELVDQHLVGEARHGYLEGISASKSFWKNWDDQVVLPPNIHWHSRLLHSVEIRQPIFIINDKVTNPMHLIRWRLILEWLTHKVNMSLQRSANIG